MASNLLRRSLVYAGVIGATAFVTATVVSQPDQKPQGDAQAQADQMMQAMMEAAQPGPEHQRLMKRAGTWKQKMTYWPYPGAAPTESLSHAEDQAIFGGRYLIERVHGEMEMGEGKSMPFEGMGIYGFDNIKQVYVFAWIDSMGTMIMTGEGDGDAHENIITYYAKMPNPLDGTPINVKMIQRVFNDNEWGLQWFEDLGHGQWHKSMELVASRE